MWGFITLMDAFVREANVYSKNSDSGQYIFVFLGWKPSLETMKITY